MQDVLALDDGRVWKRLETLADGAAASKASETAVHVYFESELRWRAIGGPSSDFLGLFSPDGSHADVVLMVGTGPDKGFGPSMGQTHVAGFRNQDAYGPHGDAVDALAEHLGVPLRSDVDQTYGAPRS